MSRQVVHAAAFEADLRAQVAYLERHEHWNWIDRLEGDIGALETLLSAYPRAGREIRRRGNDTLRRAALRSTPFFVWYQLDEADEKGPVTLYRLFHVRERRRGPAFLQDEYNE